MCGIVGYASARSPIGLETLVAMRDSMAHRGPDGAGLWRSDDGTVGLGHRRLAIVDLTPGGAQPMWSRDKRFIITYNGEIYNHHDLRDELRTLGWNFASTSDTEVILAAWQHWGRGMLARMSGMFALVIYDTQARTLFAARDRAGEKPFFYRHAGGRFVFASELKGILAHPEMPRRASRDALNEYIAYGYVPRDQCILEGYAKLPAGHWLDYDLKSNLLDVQRYWALPRWQGGPERSWDELADEFEPLLDTAVRRQMGADVPVGILLSGGLDSSLIAEAATRTTSKATTFTIGFPGHGALDESPIAKRLASELGTNHVELMAESDSIELFPTLAAQFDEPIADSSMIPTFMVSRLVRSQATVALGGDGGDELFGGYTQYSWAAKFAMARRFGLDRLPLASRASGIIPVASRFRKSASRILDRDDAAITLSRLADPALRRQLLRPSGPVDGPEAQRRALIADRHDPRERAMALDFLTYMCDDILVKVDRASMLTSLEVRAPLLDHAIVEFAFSALSPDQRVGGGERKRLLRRVARRRLPAWFDVVRKQGFSIPLASWLQGPWGSLVSDLAASGPDSLLDPVAVRSFVRSGTGTPRLAHQIYQLAILQLWARHYRVSLA